MDTWDIRSLELEPHRPQILRTDKEARLIAINLPGGEELQEHQTHERGYLFVIDGQVQIAENGEDGITAGPGFLAHFEPKERREVRARDDARLVLLLGPWPGEGHYPYNR